MELKLRPAKTVDFKEVFKLLKQLWPDLELDYNKLKSVFQLGLISSSQRFIVGEIDDKIIGFCSLTVKNNLWQAGNLGHIDELIIDNEYRGKGYGKTMIDAISEIAKKEKCKRVELDTAFHRKDAHRFYESIGYENRAYLFSKTI